MRKGSKMTKAQRIKHSKAIKAGWARRKAALPQIPDSVYEPGFLKSMILPTGSIRERIASIVREEVDKRLDELFA